MRTLAFSLSGFEIQQIVRSETILMITACATSLTAICPSCQQISRRVHSYYTRSPQDLPISGQVVQLVLRVRRFRCQNRLCQKQTFAERLPELPVWARQTSRLGAILESIAVVLSGQAGSRLTEQLAMPVSADTLLRRAKKKTPMPPTPRVLGVDDLAFRRGHTYGAILVDLLTHRPVDVLADRSAETFACWLSSHPGVEWISRDRSKEFARGANMGAPQAQQILDRWHVLKNLREVVERVLNRLHPHLSRLPGKPEPTMPSLRQRRTSTERARTEGAKQRRLALYEQVLALYKQGGSIQGIAKELGISLRTVRLFVRAGAFPERAKPTRTKSALDPYRSTLQRLWERGCHIPNELWQELVAQGFSGSYMMVYRWVQLQREVASSSAAKAKGQAALSAPRHLAWLLVRDPAQLDQQELSTLSMICQERDVLFVYQLAQQLTQMVKERNADLLESWLLTCLASGIVEVEKFAQDLQKEFSALQTALMLPYSNGPVEGLITKVKFIKRSMYGRGGFPLLRQRVLKAA